MLHVEDRLVANSITEKIYFKNQSASAFLLIEIFKLILQSDKKILLNNQIGRAFSLQM